MYKQDLEVEGYDASTTFFLAVHHLQLAAGLFDRFTPDEFAAARVDTGCSELVASMVAAVSAEMELGSWLSSHKLDGGHEMAAYPDGDPAIESIWDRYAAEIRVRLSAAGRSEEGIEDQIGDMGSVLHEIREAQRAEGDAE